MCSERKEVFLCKARALIVLKEHQEAMESSTIRTLVLRVCKSCCRSCGEVGSTLPTQKV